MLEEINTANFQEKVVNLTDGKIVMVDFFTTWCGPCTQLLPVLEELNTENVDITIYKLDCELSPDTATEYGIDYFPTVIFFRDGVAISVMHGNVAKDFFIDRLFRLASLV